MWLNEQNEKQPGAQLQTIKTKRETLWQKDNTNYYQHLHQLLQAFTKQDVF